MVYGVYIHIYIYTYIYIYMGSISILYIIYRVWVFGLGEWSKGHTVLYSRAIGLGIGCRV